ncbi:MAG: hypothetical protein HY089_05760, partial [Ignavibacteriales bacterium]|nr:hypothetical protein [Ignavibacteriales bacterium]
RWILIPLLTITAFIIIDKVLEGYNSGRNHEQTENHAFADSVNKLLGSTTFTPEELKLAEKFETDTLPTILKTGLVKQFKRNEGMTFVMVDGTKWIRQEHATKADLIFEIVITNKVRGYASALQVLDYKTGKLYANIRPPSTVEMHD